jgi:hypothetical protein
LVTMYRNFTIPLPFPLALVIAKPSRTEIG